MTSTVHKFEQAGLGKAPFRYIGSYRDVGPHKWVDERGVQCEAGAPGQPMGTCDYCGQGIAICCQIESSDGKRFVVGSDCVAKTGDAGLKRVVQADARKAQKAREQQRIADMRERLACDTELRAKLAALPHPQEWRAEKGETLLDSVDWMMARAGHAGRLKTVRQIERIEKGA